MPATCPPTHWLRGRMDQGGGPGGRARGEGQGEDRAGSGWQRQAGRAQVRGWGPHQRGAQQGGGGGPTRSKRYSSSPVGGTSASAPAPMGAAPSALCSSVCHPAGVKGSCSTAREGRLSCPKAVSFFHETAAPQGKAGFLALSAEMKGEAAEAAEGEEGGACWQCRASAIRTLHLPVVVLHPARILRKDPPLLPTACAIADQLSKPPHAHPPPPPPPPPPPVISSLFSLPPSSPLGCLLSAPAVCTAPASTARAAGAFNMEREERLPADSWHSGRRFSIRTHG